MNTLPALRSIDIERQRSCPGRHTRSRFRLTDGVGDTPDSPTFLNRSRLAHRAHWNIVSMGLRAGRANGPSRTDQGCCVPCTPTSYAAASCHPRRRPPSGAVTRRTTNRSAHKSFFPSALTEGTVTAGEIVSFPKHLVGLKVNPAQATTGSREDGVSSHGRKQNGLTSDTPRLGPEAAGRGAATSCRTSPCFSELDPRSNPQ